MPTVLNFTSTFGLARSRLAIVLLARSTSRRTNTVTLLPYLVKNIASSAAESPPPITTSGFLRNIGIAPSHTAHADTPFCQYVSSPCRPRRRALAPVARTTASAVSVGSFSLPSAPSFHSLKGRDFKSSFVIVSVMMWVPNRSDCARISSISCGPEIPLGKPGKFSTSVVVVSWPPAAVPFANMPSYIVGCSSALDR